MATAGPRALPGGYVSNRRYDHEAALAYTLRKKTKDSQKLGLSTPFFSHT